MRSAEVSYKNKIVGILTQTNKGEFIFTYDDIWLANTNNPSLGFTLPITKKSHVSDYIFSLFYNMLPEGSNKELICKQLKIDKDDDFGLLLAVASKDTIGAISVKLIS
jgi:HipA-like protein